MASSMIRDLGRKFAPRIAKAASFHSSARAPALGSQNALTKYCEHEPKLGSSHSPWGHFSSRGSMGLTTMDDSPPPTLAALRNPNSNIQYDDIEHERYPPGEPDRAAYVYFLTTGARFVYAAGIRVYILKLVLTMAASKDVLALSSLEVDLSNVEMGSTISLKWRGKPVFVRHRTEEEIATANSVPVNSLRDPQQDGDRVINPEWLVVIGVCTHLGCVPLPNAGEFGGWFCPCHGSHYDVSGRVRKGPAPLNLEVPQYKFLDEKKILIG